MADRSFPETAPPPFLRPTAVEIVIPRQPLANIFQALGISIHDVVNRADHRVHVRGLYKIARRMDNEGWLRRRFEQNAYESWIDAHL
jgi:hypothetical protein